MMSSRPRRGRLVLVRAGFVSALASAAIVAAAGPAVAGGSWLDPARDRYEPGEVVTMVGYVGATGSLGSAADGPFFAYLRRLDAPLGAPNELQMAPFTPLASDLPLGELVLEHQDRADYAEYRVTIEFVAPRDLPPGRYGVIYCNATCTKGLSDLIGGEVFVGTDPDQPLGRTWLLDEPEIANLADDAMLYGPGWQVTAADARARSAPPASTARRIPVVRDEALDRSSYEEGARGWLIPTLAVMAVVAAAGGAVALSRRRAAAIGGRRDVAADHADDD